MKPMTLKEWGELPEDTEGELVNGVLVDDEMTTLAHDRLMSFLLVFFYRWVHPRGGDVLIERKIGVSRNTGRKPDVAVYLPGTKGLTGTTHVTMTPPDIAIEIVSPRPRDTRRDRVEKRHDYARFGVRWYWIVDPALRTIEILELSPKGRYTHVADASSGKLRPPGCGGRSLDVDALWRDADRAT